MVVGLMVVVRLIVVVGLMVVVRLMGVQVAQLNYQSFSF